MRPNSTQQPLDGDFWDGDLADDSLECEHVTYEGDFVTPEGKAFVKKILDEIEAKRYQSTSIFGKHAERNPKVL